MELKFVHLYPDLMSLYGSYANVAVLRRRMEQLGNAVTVISVAPGEELPADADFLFMGAGTERAQKAALADFIRFGAQIIDMAEAGGVMLFAGAAMELLGRRITDCSGKEYEGVGLAEFTSVQGARRLVGDVYGHTTLYEAPVVGFMNKCSVISGVETPLLSALDMGIGNEGERTPEGFCRNHVFASHLTGPILVKNPRLLDVVASAVYRQRGEIMPEPPADHWLEDGYSVTEVQLRLRK